MLELITVKDDESEFIHINVYDEGMLENYSISTVDFNNSNHNIYTIVSRDPRLKVKSDGDVYYNDTNITYGCGLNVSTTRVSEMDYYIPGESISDEITFSLTGQQYVSRLYVTQEYLESLYERYGQEVKEC